MKYVLSKGTVLRREWFGCLYYHTYTGCFRQFNEDAFEILQRLKTPITIEYLKNDLQFHGMNICKNKLQEFISHYFKQGLIAQQNKAEEITIFDTDIQVLRKDCLIAPLQRNII